MVWDLGKAMRRKEEFESARLMDFEFRQRARATRLLARRHGLDEAELIREIAVLTEPELVAWVAARSGKAQAEIAASFQQCLALARRELIDERGDPTPYRLG